MKRAILLFALLCAVALGSVMAAQGHPVVPPVAGTETVLSQQDVGLAAAIGIAPEAAGFYAVFDEGGEAARPLCLKTGQLQAEPYRVSQRLDRRSDNCLVTVKAQVDKPGGTGRHTLVC